MTETPLQAQERVDKQLYQLTLTGKQARYIQQACEVYERLHAGQWFALEDILPFKKGHYFWEIEPIFKNLIEQHLDTEKFYFERISGDIMNVIRHRLSWDRYPSGGITVNFDTPIQFGSEPLAKIEKVAEK